MNKLFIITAFILLLAGTFAGLKGFERPGVNKGSHTTAVSNSTLSELMNSLQIKQLVKEQSPPDFQLRSLEGDQSRLSQYHGNVVLVSFWATW